ncbi:class I SAM-dependent methyltransferase [Yoonia maritima]|uniref:class I SAM-dependent methyltransferase n=1 Tax=Yoonia maritima TaxID=1435347 RepID=UPI00373568D9
MSTAAFWDKIAPKYAKKPVPDESAYQATLERTRSYLNPADHLLEIGCGTGSTALNLAPAVAHITATDISSQMLAIAEAKLSDDAPSNISFLQVPALKPLAAAPFDAICAFSILHLLDDLPAAIAHLKAQVKPGGYVISKTGCIGDMNRAIPLVIRLMQLFKKAPFVNVFTADALEAAFRDAGFQIVETGHFGKDETTHFIVARRPA